jgi:hypothetical protein
MWGRWYVASTSIFCRCRQLGYFEGLGAMTEWRDIVKIVVDRMKLVLKESKS